MIRNYLIVGFRALTKNRAYAVINVLGLAIGMAACLLILLYVRYERTYDHWIPGVENSYQLQTWNDGFETGTPGFEQMAAYAAGTAIRKDFPEVEKVVYMLWGSPVLFQNGEGVMTRDYRYVDGNFLDVVDLPLLRGVKAGLSKQNTMMVTRSEAIARFGTDDVVGRTMTLVSKGQHRTVRVVGVLRDLPRNSSLSINALVNVDFPALFEHEAKFLKTWSEQSGWVFVKLRPGTDPRTIEARLPAWEKRNIPGEDIGTIHYNAGDHADWHLVRLTNLHLGRAQSGSQTPGNDRRSLVTYAVIAMLILGMAVVNFTNLATARASQRAREVALRKALGASRGQLVAQFIAESVLVAMIAMLIALAIVEVGLPTLSSFLNADLELHYVGSDGVLMPVIGLVLMVGVLGGLYPAFFLSGFQPAAVLRANRSAAETPGTGRLRTALVVCQFGVSIGLIICTAVVYAQTIYARSVDPGFRRNNILQVENLNRAQIINLTDEIVARVKKVPGVDAVGATTIGIDTSSHNSMGVFVPGNSRQFSLSVYHVDTGFLAAMGQKLLAGRWFNNGPTDDATMPYPMQEAAMRALVTDGVNVVINELAAKSLGFATPADAIGKKIRIGLVELKYGLVPATIVGVVNNARYRSVRDPIEPIIFDNQHSGLTNLVVRYHGDPNAVHAGIGKVWRSLTNEVPYEANFSEDIVGKLYKAEAARAETFAGFAALSVVVGCLGLFGLASFTAERRTKEIGIRKVLGARTRDIVGSLVWQFSRPVLVANLIAWPIAWWVMRDWLSKFDARIALGPTPFLTAGLIALAIAVATIAAHAVLVARANPVRALRYE